MTETKEIDGKTFEKINEYKRSDGSTVTVWGSV